MKEHTGLQLLSDRNNKKEPKISKSTFILPRETHSKVQSLQITWLEKYLCLPRSHSYPNLIMHLFLIWPNTSIPLQLMEKSHSLCNCFSNLSGGVGALGQPLAWGGTRDAFVMLRSLTGV